MSALSIAAARTRQEVEGALARKAPSALSPRPRTIRERMVCGVKALDALLEGGLPVGAISEFVGVTGSGRTTVAMAFAAATAREAKVAAWVDVNDAFDPAGAALNGVELERLLWVCRGSRRLLLPRRRLLWLSLRRWRCGAVGVRIRGRKAMGCRKRSARS
jgi:recombination protein RecA